MVLPTSCGDACQNQDCVCSGPWYHDPHCSTHMPGSPCCIDNDCWNVEPGMDMKCNGDGSRGICTSLNGQIGAPCRDGKVLDCASGLICSAAIRDPWNNQTCQPTVLPSSCGDACENQDCVCSGPWYHDPHCSTHMPGSPCCIDNDCWNVEPGMDMKCNGHGRRGICTSGQIGAPCRNGYGFDCADGLICSAAVHDAWNNQTCQRQ